MKYREDARSIFFCILTLGLMIVGLSADFGAEWLVLLIPLQTYLSFTCCIINHNHTHAATFANEKLNAIFELLLTIAKGHTALGVVVPHNLNHHVHVGSPHDWSHAELAGKGPGPVRILRYLLRSSLKMAMERKKPSAPKLTPELEARKTQQKLFLFLVSGFALFYAPQKFLLLWALPWFVAIESMLAINFIQHDGTGRASRDFTGKLGNYLLFNNGYHTVHHEVPALHWSKLPAQHVARSTDVTFFPGYVLKNYLLR